jgi:DNA-binding transcriptional MocR family regulator
VSGKAPPVVGWRRSILKDGTLSPKAKYIALVLMDHMDGAGGSCYPSLTTLSQESGNARRTVCYALDELESAGYVIRRRGGPKTGPTHYLAASAHSALPLVHHTHLGSAPDAPEGGQESGQKISMRATRARRKKQARAFGAPDFEDLNLEAYDRA